MYFIFFATTFSIYVYYVSEGKEKYDKMYKKFGKFIYALIAILCMAVLALPIELSYGEMVYSYGMAVDLIFAYAFINITICIILLLKNIRKIKDKRYIPLVIYIFGSGVVGFVQKMNPAMTLSTTMDAIVLFIMYFTIENPDIKLLEETHKSKEISDAANEEKTMFLYNMTQDIRNITNDINDDADLILESKDVSEMHDGARDIKALTSKFTNMTNEILDVSNVEASNLKVYNSKYNIKNVLKQLVNVYTDICKNKELKFRTNIDHDIPESLYGDSINLKEVLNTVLSNSTKYTEKGYVEFTVNTIIKSDICRIIFTIEDSGTGIKSEDIDKIKVDNKSLAKANRLLTMMNGAMMISSDYGVGTKVKIILDQKIGEEEPTEAAKYDSVFDNTSILAIDDSEAGLKIIEKLLKGTNVLLDMASTGKECLDKLKIGKYDLVLLDEELSQISGAELLSKIKELRNFKTPIILLTKDNSYEYNEETEKLGFADYLLKPLKKEDLIEKINKYTKEGKK
jgi:CheY-like chemotaxis protein